MFILLGNKEFYSKAMGYPYPYALYQPKYLDFSYLVNLFPWYPYPIWNYPTRGGFWNW